MLGLIIRLSALSFGLCYATLPSAHLPPSQALTALNDRMNEMINALYASSPVLAKLKAAATPAPKPAETTEAASTDTSPKNEYEQYYQISAPQTYLPSPTPTQKTLEAGLQPTDYAYPTISHPFPRSIFPPFQFPLPAPYPAVPYPCEYHQQYPEYPVFPTPFLPPTTSHYAAAPCPCQAAASFPPTTPPLSPAAPSYTSAPAPTYTPAQPAPPSYAPAQPSYSPAQPSYAPAPQTLPMTSYQHYSYQSQPSQSYQTAPSNYSPSSAQGEATATPQCS